MCDCMNKMETLLKERLMERVPEGSEVSDSILIKLDGITSA